MTKSVNKVKRIIIICVCVALFLFLIGGSIYLLGLFGVGIFNKHDKTAYAENRELLTFRQPFSSDYIWIEKNGTAVWAAFSKDVYLSEDADLAVFDIACDTYYWLWVNGQEIVWEGSLKRGVTPTDGFYDRVEIKNTFKAGKNNVSVLVRHLGDDGFSHKDSEQGFLIIEGKIGDTPFNTDGSWKAKKYAYNYSAFDFLNNLNFRLSERGSKVDGEQYDSFWLLNDTSSWNAAVVLDKEKSEKQFGRNYLNPLPQKTVSDVIYFDLGDKVGVKTTKRTAITFDLDCNVQFCPYFEFEADRKGRKIVYYTENKKLNYKNVYYSKAGENEFLDFAWINGEKLTVVLEKGITLKSIGYRQTGYNTTDSGVFTCVDEELNSLCQKAVNTLKVTMRDSYMDCPDRERAQWIGDAVIESDMSFYALAPQSSALFKKAILTTYGWTHIDGVIQTVVPDGVNAYELPVQNLAFLIGCVNYVNYSGDTSVVPMILSMAEGYLPLWKMKDGLIVHRKGSWDWSDWGKNADVSALENAWYYYAMSKLITIAPTDSEFTAFCKQRMDEIKKAYTAFYKENGISSKRNYDDRANAIAVLTGLYKVEDAEKISNTLYSVRNSSPYMEKYVEQALCELGRVDLAILRAKEMYADMILDDTTTLWEFWQKRAGTTNHAWAGGSLYVLTRYVCGIYPTDSGFKSFVIEPNTDVLSNFSVCVTPCEGVEISVSAKVTDEGKKQITVYCSTDGGTLKVQAKNSNFNAEITSLDNTAEMEFILQKGYNTLIYD